MKREFKVSVESLRVLDAIDRFGSFAAAAAQLCVVTSSITHTVRNLEEALGIAIFDRSGRRARFTAEGTELLAQGRVLLAHAKDFDARVQVIATGWEPRLSIAVDGVVRMEPLVRCMQEFFEQAPGVSIGFRREVAAGCWDALQAGRCDLAVGAPADGVQRSGVQTRRLGDMQLVFCVAPDHPLARCKGPVAATEVVRHRAVLLGDTAQDLPRLPLQLLESVSRVSVPDTETKLRVILQGIACGFLPETLAEQYASSGQLVRLQVEIACPPAQCELAWRAGDAGRALAWWVSRLAQPDVAADLLR